MTTPTYSNLPTVRPSDSTVQAFDLYFSKPLEIKAGTYDAIRGFFTSRGFDEVSAENVSIVIIKQAKQDGYNPMNVLDTLRGLGDVEISALVAEIVNYNRYKSSYLGYALEFRSNQEVARNILP